MKKDLFLVLSTIFIFLINTSIFAQSKASSMGDLITVAPSGPFDVIRNPALLPNQTASNSFGLFYTYIHYIPGENKADSYMNMDGTEFDSEAKIEDPVIFGMTCHLAYLSKSGNSAFGIAVSSFDNDQYSYNENESSFSATSTSSEIKSHEKVTSKELNPVLITSAGFTITKNSYFGVQLLAKYSRITEESKHENTITSGDSIVEEDNERRKRQVSGIHGELGLGYFYKAHNIQVGLLIRSGDFSWIKKDLNINYNKTVGTGTGEYQSDSDITINGERTSGPVFSAGGYKKINSFFAFAVESSFIFENSYTDKEFNYVSDENRIDKQENINKFRNSVAFKGGIELNPSDNLTITTGIGYSLRQFENYQVSEEHQKRTITNFKANFIFYTSGFEYKFGNNISVEVLGAYFYYNYKVDMFSKEEDETSNNEIATEAEYSGNYIFTGLGVVLNF